MSEIGLNQCGAAWMICDGNCDGCRIASYAETNSTTSKQTNADHVRSLSDEELADFLCDATYKENEHGYPIMRTVNKAWWRKWLKQPYKEDA